MLAIAQSVEPLGGWASIVAQSGAVGILVYIAWIVPNLIRTICAENRQERMSRDENSRRERKERDDTFSLITNVMHDRFDRRTEQIAEAMKTVCKNGVQEGV